MKSLLTNYPNLEIRKANVKDVILSHPSEPQKVIGLRVGTPFLPELNVILLIRT